MTIARFIHRNTPVEALVAGWRMLVRNVAGAYRPECHYMRGPGPKCRVQHQARADGPLGD
jgi:hypothetical protein